MKISKEKRAASARSSERGIALLTALLMLLLLSAMAVGMMYISNTDSQINANFRSEQQAYFAARAGMEELRDRMRLTSANTITGTPGLPTDVPGMSSNSVVYLINQVSSSDPVEPWTAGSKYADTEICHDGFSNFSETNSSIADVPCSGSSLGSLTSSTYKTVASVLPFNGTTAAIPFKWARLTLKQANSVLGHPVDPLNSSSTSQICWNNSYEVQLTKTACLQQDGGDTPVYMITALAVTNTGARRMVQAEVAQQPLTSNHYGLFATASGCGAVNLQGGATVDSYNSANGAYGGSNVSESGGSVGSNGNILAGGSNVSIGGSVYSPITPSVLGSCPGSPLSYNGSGSPFYPGVGNTIQPISTQTPNTPTIPADGTTLVDNKYLKNNVSQCTSGGATGYCLSPGKYGDISISSSTVLILQSGTYNINTISEAGSATLYITGPVTLNVTGSGGGTVVKLTGGGFFNTTGTPGDFQINYAGTGEVDLAGGNQAAILVNAPNAYTKLTGNSSYYGAILSNTIYVGGGANFHYDSNTQIPLPVATYFTLLSYRELYY